MRSSFRQEDMSNASGVLDREALAKMFGAVAFAALGVSVALCIASIFFPVSAPLSGSNLEIVPSLQRLAHPEPREKGFLFLAAVLGFLGSLIGAGRARAAEPTNVRKLLILLTLVPGLNIWIGLAMSHSYGIAYALLALLHSLAIIKLIVRCDPDETAGNNGI